MTVTELIAILVRHDGDRVVYVGTKDAIAQAVTVEDDCFELKVGPAVLIESGHEE